MHGLSREHGLDRVRAEAVSGATGDRNWPQGHGRLGRTAVLDVLEKLVSGTKEVVDPDTGEVCLRLLTFDEAVVQANYPSHSDLDKSATLARLPYYGEVLERHVAFGTGEPRDGLEKRIGKLTNPTVHVALNQLRKVVNALVERWGMPAQIVVELARELPLSAKGKSELKKIQAENQKLNEEREMVLAEHSQRNNYENRLRLRLWEELNPSDPLNRCCPFTGEQIGIERVFSDEVEIEHILPFSRTLDNGIANQDFEYEVCQSREGA